jgi:hypothetical protein
LDLEKLAAFKQIGRRSVPDMREIQAKFQDNMHLGNSRDCFGKP